MRAVELFAGAGGLSCGLEQAGFEVVAANEIESDFAATFSANHPATKVISSDIGKTKSSQLIAGIGGGKVNLVSGGPPCQGFSTVGAKDKNDPRNSLFREYLRVVADLDPEYILFENVPGFRNMYGGAVHEILLKELMALGYLTKGAVIDSSDFGLPQVRLRTIIVGWKENLHPVMLPAITHCSAPPPGSSLKRKLTVTDAISDLPVLSSGTSSSLYHLPPQNDFQKAMRGSETVLTEHSAANYGKLMRDRFAKIPAGGSVADLPPRMRPKSYFANTYARLHSDRPAPTITRNFGTPSSSRCIHPSQDRALSTREGARLQGFPDSYKFHGSKTSKNLQIGNAVPPVLGKAIAQSIAESAKISKRA
jgi:DNA (cytosine-5)-methyltransferase 1